MASIFSNLKNDKQYKASTGFSRSEFELLFSYFEQLYIPKTNTNPYLEPKLVLSDAREALFFVLHYLKAYPTLLNMSLYFGISEFSVSTYIEQLKPLLKATLLQADASIRRSFGSEKEFAECFAHVKDIVIDVFEISTQRPVNQDIQKEMYSGKKNFTP